MMNISPTQNVGSEKPRMEPAITALENPASGFSPAKTPKGIPKMTASTNAASASSKVAGMRSAMMSSDDSE